GRGIAPEFLPQIFEPFRQADDVKLRKSGGLGLGLAIVRSLVEQHRGTVKAESAGEGSGSTFTITLPLDDAEVTEPADPEDGRRTDGQRLDAVPVLIVDAGRAAGEALGALLAERGARVGSVGPARSRGLA